MTRRRAASSCALALVLSLVPVLSGSPAVARWNIHNDADVTQMKAPPGGTEDQTCADRLRGETGWSTFIEEGQDPNTFMAPPEAYTPSSYTVWKAPPGFANFDSGVPQTDASGELIGYEFTDASGNVLLATRLLQFRTANRTALGQPIPIEGNPGVYVFTTAPISVRLPHSVASGDAIGLLPQGGEGDILDLSVVRCRPSAHGVGITVVKQVRFTRTVATFTGPGGVSDYRASVRWGDGSNASAGTITLASNGFRVTGTHKYMQRGIYQIRVKITQFSTGIVVRTQSRATVRSPG